MASKVKKDRRLRILWSSNGFWTGSGYANVAKGLLGRLLDDGWTVGHVAFYGLESYPQFMDIQGKKKVHKIKVYPRMSDFYGSDALIHFGKDFNADIIFTHQDIWTLNPNFLQQLTIPFIGYVPIDQNPVSPLVLDRLRYAYQIITYSKYGQKTLEKHGFASSMIPHGVETDIFKPLNKQEMRKKLGISPNAFLFGVIGANKENPPRKGYQEMLDAFDIFRKNHPEAMIMFHTQQTAPGNFPIMEYARYLGFSDKAIFLNPILGTHFFDSKKVCEEINCFDICLHTSHTEGFGLVIVESQACGIPVIVTDGMSMPELVIEGKTGEVAEVASKRFSPAQGYWVVPSVPSIVQKMEILYKKLHEKNTIAKDCRDFIMKNYNIDTLVKEKWIPYLERLQKDILTEEKKDDKIKPPDKKAGK